MSDDNREPRLGMSGWPGFTPSEDYKPDPYGRLRRMKPEDWPMFRIVVADTPTPIVVADSLDELLEAGRQLSEYMKSARAAESDADKTAYCASLRSDATALDRLHRPNRLPVIEEPAGAALDQMSTEDLARRAHWESGKCQYESSTQTVGARRELRRRAHLVGGEPDHEPPDGPHDSPDPEATTQP